MCKSFKTNMLCLFLVLLLCSGELFSDVIYVDDDATGDNDGSGWSNAFTSLAEALGTAQSGDEVRVAEGRYRPTDGLIWLPEFDPRELTFQLKEGVTVKGGYAGDSGRPGIRDIYEHFTILDGDIGVEGVETDNSYHVVTGADNAILDGFIVMGGYTVDYITPPEMTYGAGMFNLMVTNLTISNCTFRGNWARFGGGIYNRECDVVLRNCEFYDNSAVYDGGAFRDIYGVLVIMNCTVHGNSADTGGQGYLGGGIASYDSDVAITNSIFWANNNNGVIDESAQIFSDSGVISVSYSCIQGLDTLAGMGNIGADPLFVSASRPMLQLRSQAGYWVSSGFWILDQVTSPCIDAGDPSSPIGLEPFPNGGRVNMGAYGGTEKASKSYFGTTPCGTIMAGDINGDCSIDLLDIAILASHWLWQE